MTKHIRKQPLNSCILFLRDTSPCDIYGRLPCFFAHRTSGNMMSRVLRKKIWREWLLGEYVILGVLGWHGDVVVVRTSGHYRRNFLVHLASPSAHGIVLVIWAVNHFMSLFAGTAKDCTRLGLPPFDFCPYHESTKIGLAANEVVMSVRSSGISSLNANKRVHIQSWKRNKTQHK
jgi:hypothetical protein